MKTKTIIYAIVAFLLILASIILPHLNAQTIDTVITNDVYTSYFNKTLHEPVYVTYKVYKGGGNCSRVGMVFKVDDVKNTATPKDYAASGYDEGHLADAADFSGDCIKEEKTFRFYNCVPQTPHLNRGIWKHYESEVRKLSHTDSLLVITGSTFNGSTIPNTNVAIPNYCWKVVQSLTTKKIIYCFIISNDNACMYSDVLILDLEKKLGYNLPIKN
jgi:endonuclease G, mitochondrial